MRAKHSPLVSFCSLFFSIATLIYCSATGVFPAAATVGTKSVRSEACNGCWFERQVLADGVTPHGITRAYSRENGQTYQLSEMVYWRGDQIEWTEFWPSGKIRARSFEAYLGGPVRYEIFDEEGALVRVY